MTWTRVSWAGLRWGSGRGCVGGLQLLPDDLDLAFVARDTLTERAKFRHAVFQALEALVHLALEIIETLALGVEALLNRVEDAKEGKRYGVQCSEFAAPAVV